MITSTRSERNTKSQNTKTFSNKTAFHLLAVSLCVSFVSCTKKTEIVPSSAVVVVNGDSLNATDFSKELARKVKHYSAVAAKDKSNIDRVKKSIVEDFITSTLLQQYAKSQGLSVSESEVMAEVEKMKNSYPDNTAFMSVLAESGASAEDLKARATRSLLERKAFALLDKGVEEMDNQEARKYYEENKKAFMKGERVKIRQIVVNKEDDAERLLKKLKAGGNFKELASRFSVSPDAKDGGEIGYQEKGAVPAFDAAFKLRPGQLSPVVKSSYGFHILMVLDKKPAGPLSFEEVKNQIAIRLKAEKQQRIFDKWLRESIKVAKIEKNEKLIESISIHTEE